MARQHVQFEIRKPFGAPAGAGYSLNVITARQWANIETAVNIVRVDIDPAETEPRTHAVMPAWRYGWNDDLCRLERWHCRPVPGEEEAVEAAGASLRQELADLLAQSELPEAQQQRVWEIRRDLQMLATNRFWYQAHSPFGDGRMALYRGCNAPNVPFRLRSNWRLAPDRPFTLWLHRCKPHEAQADCWVRFRFGHWALVVSQEREVRLLRYKDGAYYTDHPDLPGRGLGTWEHFDGQDFDVTDAMEDGIEDIRDQGRLSAQDRLQIHAWESEIRAKQDEKKKRSRTWTGHQKAAADAYIKARREWIKQLKTSRRSTKEQQQTIQEMAAQLYGAEVSVQWQHMAESTFSRDLAITVIPQPKGFVVLHNSIGKDYFVFRDDEVADSGVEDTIVHGTPLQVDGNGGALWFGVSYIEPEGWGMMESRRVFVAGGAPVVGEAALHWNASVPAQGAISGQVTPDAGGYRWRIEMRSAQGYMPFLYSLYMDVMPVGRDRSQETVVASSPGLPDVHWTVGGNKDEANRGRSADLRMVIPAARRPALEYLAGTAGQQLSVREGATWFTGQISQVTKRDIGPHLEVRARAYDRWALLREDRMWNDVIGDNMVLGEYVEAIVRGVGLHPDEVIISGPATERRLPSAPPGEQPLFQPQWGGIRADYLQRLLDGFGYWMEMWFDGEGKFHFEPISTTTKPIRFERGHGAGHAVMLDVEEDASPERFVNYILVLGRKQRGKEIAAQYADHRSVHDESYRWYVGRWLADAPHHDDALFTQEMVNMCCAWLAYQRCRWEQTLRFKTHYRDDLLVGDRVWCENRVVEITGVAMDDRTRGIMGVTARVV